MENIDTVCASLLKYAKEQTPKPVNEEGEIHAHALLGLLLKDAKGIVLVKRPDGTGIDYYANGMTPGETELFLRVSWSILNH